MSTIYSTPNYDLICYKDPALLLEKDLTANFEKIDQVLYGHQVEEDSLENRMESAENDIMSLRESNTKQSNEITALQNTAVGLDTRLTKAEQDIATLQPETIDEVVERLGLAEANIKNNSELINGLEVRITDDEDNLSQHAKRLDGLDKTTSTLTTSLGTLSTEVVDIKTNVTALQEEVVKWQGDVASLDEKLTEDLQETQGLQDLVKAQTAQIETIAGQITDLQQRMSTTETKVIDLDKRVKALEQK